MNASESPDEIRQQGFEEETLPIGEPVREPESSPPSAPTKFSFFSSQAFQFLIRAAATILAIWLLLTFVIGICVCHSDACSPAVKDGDLCVTWKLAQPSPGDMLVFTVNGERKFARVVAAAGDHVEIKDSYVWVNGYIALQDPLPDSSYVLNSYVVPERCVFVISPHASTDDSRTFGAIPLDNCSGKVVFLMRRRGI